MDDERQRISYIRKPFARRGFVSAGFAAAALVCFGVSLGISVYAMGNAELDVAAWGFSSLVFSVVAVCYGAASFTEKEVNMLLARIGLGIGTVLLVFWVCMVLLGLLL
ncbi:MAG: calcium:proton exchanger [Clostridiales bacterium]|nr:calcium:proton exchanger [Clostridiales bacterium]